MVNINIGNSIKSSSSLLPLTTDTTDISGESFKAVLQNMQESNNNSSDNNIIPSINKSTNKENISTSINKEIKANNKLGNNNEENYGAIENVAFIPANDFIAIDEPKTTLELEPQPQAEQAPQSEIQSEVQPAIEMPSQRKIQSETQTQPVLAQQNIISSLFAGKLNIDNSLISNNENVIDIDDFISDINSLNISNNLKSQVKDTSEPASNNNLPIDNNAEILSTNFDISNINQENIADNLLNTENILNNNINLLQENLSQANLSQINMAQDNILQTENNITNNQINNAFLLTENNLQNETPQQETIKTPEILTQTQQTPNTDNLPTNQVADSIKPINNTQPQDDINLDDIDLTKDIDIADDIKLESKPLEENIKDIARNTSQNTDKQSSTSQSDIQKEFKSLNAQVVESLRGESARKGEMASKVNLNEASKDLNNNLSNKEILNAQNNKNGENFSTSNQEQGNNFNNLLKLSAEAQAKSESMNNSNNSQATYNMQDTKDIDRLIRTMQTTFNKGESKLTVELTPASLGKLQIQLIESNGKVTAKFLTDSQESHKLIMAQSELLKNQLSVKGIVIDNMEFAFNDTTSKQQANEGQNRRAFKNSSRNKDDNNQEDTDIGTQLASRKVGLYA